jgi:predicted lysophospholipase L1 biosynthesis ABC-type transport system permease subunit
MLPATLNPFKSHVSLTPLAEVDDTSPVQQALRRYWKLNTSALMYIVIAVTLLSVLVGVLVGVFAHNASLGIAATSGFAAILSSIAGILVLRFRRCK